MCHTGLHGTCSDALRPTSGTLLAPMASHRLSRSAFERLQEELAQKLGTAVRIKQQGKGRGVLMVSYGSLDQLDAVIEKLRG